ncbi:MAG: PTS sugar transporter subunit IIC [Elusimicrobiota bacterium]|jgi:mannose/fructose/N-acetylgalactosamine-specific phosphotransferase system component IIC|nr:PTS sugar transporter subunit IIC [Elusimicrobiota bacterium]
MITQHLIIAAILAALCSCDAVAFGQFMFSRPMFCAPIFGYLTGDIWLGLWIGMIVEMIWLNSVPLGASLPSDISTIAILPVLWTAIYFPHIKEAAVFGLLLSVPFSYFCKEIDILGRKINTNIMRWVERGLYEYKESRIDIAAFAGLALFFLKFFLFYAAAIYLGGALFRTAFLFFDGAFIDGFKKLWYLLPILGLGSAVYNFVNIKFFTTKK